MVSGICNLHFSGITKGKWKPRSEVTECSCATRSLSPATVTPPGSSRVCSHSLPLSVCFALVLLCCPDFHVSSAYHTWSSYLRCRKILGRRVMILQCKLKWKSFTVDFLERKTTSIITLYLKFFKVSEAVLTITVSITSFCFS